MSGLYDQDYPNLAEVGYGLDSVAEVNIEKRVPLPPELVEQFGRILHCQGDSVCLEYNVD